VIISQGNKKAQYDYVPFIRKDTGIPVPNDGNIYYRILHEVELFGGVETRETVPAIANARWGIETEAKANGDYYPITDKSQWWFYNFWDWASGYRLPQGQKTGEYINPMNPNIVYTSYTSGSLLGLYAGMIKDAKSHTDSASPETGARDVVTGRNLPNKPWEWLCRPCTGAILQVSAIVGSKLKIKCIDLLKPLPAPNTLAIHEYYFGTQVHPSGQVSRYPDVKEAFAVHGFDPAGTAMPLVAPGGYFWIDKRACVRLLPGEIWKPYL